MPICFSCSQDNDSTWQYCWSCGTVLATIGELSDETCFAAPGEKTVQHVAIRTVGHAEIEIGCVLEQQSQVAPRLLSDRMTISGNGTIDVLWPEGSDGHGLLSIGSDDAPRQDPWHVRSWRTQTISVARQSARRELVVEPAMILFSAGLKEREIKLYNPGPMPIGIHNVQASFGYRWVSTDPIPVTLKAGERAVGVLQRTGNGGPDAGELQITIDQDKVVTQIRSLKPAAPVPIPPYTVSIDFGTSHTSIALRKAGSKDPVFLSPDQKERFPTQIYCRTAQDSTWLYGLDAARAFQQDGGRRRGHLVLELKNLLRCPDDDLFTEWPGVTPRRLLTWYLQRLLIDLIMPYFLEHDKAASKSLRFIFSFPVLDGQVAAEHQRKITLDAAESAGFKRFGMVEWAFEPVCAACYALLARPRSELAPGERIMVFDSGGGTTDICIGTVAREGNHLTLRNIVTAAATLGQGVQFGGTRITSRLGKKLHQSFGRDLQIRVMYAWGEDDPNLPKYRHFLEADEPDIFGAEDMKPWPAKFPDLFALVDSAKIQQSAAPNEPAEVYAEVAQGRGRGVSLAPRLTSDTAREGMELLKPSIEELIAKGMPDKVFAVGGNSLIQDIRRALAEQVFSPQEDLTDAERNLAVVTGGLWVRELVLNTLPYTLEVTGPHSHLAFAAGSRPDPTPTAYTYWIEPETEVRYDVNAKVDEEVIPLFEVVVRNDTETGRHVTIAFGIEGNVLSMIEDASGEPAVKLRYAI